MHMPVTSVLWGTDRRIPGACWMPAELLVQWETLFERNNVESDRGGGNCVFSSSLCEHMHSVHTWTHTSHTPCMHTTQPYICKGPIPLICMINNFISIYICIFHERQSSEYWSRLRISLNFQLLCLSFNFLNLFKFFIQYSLIIFFLFPKFLPNPTNPTSCSFSLS